MSQLVILGDQYSYVAPMLASQFQMPGSVHLGMFFTGINLLGSEKQFKKYGPACLDYSVIGCYAQTQMGHGSDVQNLQTTAHYDKKSQEFILNTPTIQATKWWPGDLGLYANYAMVFAQLYIDDVKHQVAPFIVRIRDDQGRPMKGVQVGDVGPKLGFSTKDNGYLILKQVRIPRQNMLNKYLKVERDGKITIRGNPKISYATMMLIRKLISTLTPICLSIPISIAVKYSIKRKQFSQKGQEIPIIQYQTQQEKLMTPIANYFALMFVSHRITKIANRNYELIFADDDSLLAQTHSILCFSKVYSSQTVLKDMEWLRLSCGGHGYSHYSGFPSMIQQFTPNVTHQGENTILMLQTAKSLLKAISKFVQDSKPMPSSMQYLENTHTLLSKPCSVPPDSPIEIWNLQKVRVLLAQNSAFLLKLCSERMIQLSGEMGAGNAVNKKLGVHLVDLARAHAHYYYYFGFQSTVVKIRNQSIREPMFDLCLYYGTNLILQSPSRLLQAGVVSTHHLQSLRDLKDSLLQKLRPNMLGFVDSMGNLDLLERSLIGGDNDDMYERLLREAQKSNSLNKKRPQIRESLARLRQQWNKL